MTGREDNVSPPVWMKCKEASDSFSGTLPKEMYHVDRGIDYREYAE